jgi:hypothetical protein
MRTDATDTPIPVIVRRLLLVVPLVFALAACGSGGPEPSASGAPASPAPSAGGLPAVIDTPEAAFAAIVAQEPRFAGIQPRDPDLIGQARWYEAMPASGVGAFVVEVRMGWGDCPSGCIDEHRWRYAVQPDGAIQLLGESGDPVPPDGVPADGS